MFHVECCYLEPPLLSRVVYVEHESTFSTPELEITDTSTTQESIEPSSETKLPSVDACVALGVIIIVMFGMVFLGNRESFTAHHQLRNKGNQQPIITRWNMIPKNGNS